MAHFEVNSNGPSTFFLSGELDLSTVPLLELAIGDAIGGGGPVTLDLSDLRFTDSSGIGAIVKASGALPSGCIVLHGVRDGIRRVIDLMGIEKVPNVHVIPCAVPV
jgi:anti-sigma B factor antagonist